MNTKPLNSRYLITTDGKVISTNGNRKELKPYITKNGSVEVMLYINGKRCHMTVPYLVATAHIPNPNNLPHIIHKDGNKRNNTVENLEWSVKMDGH